MTSPTPWLDSWHESPDVASASLAHAAPMSSVWSTRLVTRSEASADVQDVASMEFSPTCRAHSPTPGASTEAFCPALNATPNPTQNPHRIEDASYRRLPGCYPEAAWDMS